MSYNGYCKECFDLLTLPSTTSYFDHKLSYADLCNSIEQGCQLCKILHDAWLENLSRKRNLPRDEIVQLALTNKTSFNIGGDEQFTISPLRLTHQSDALEIGPVIDELSYGCIFHGETEASSVVIHLALIHGQLAKIAGRLVPQNVDLRLCRQWLDDCVRDHATCPDLVKQPLPTRILDVSPKDGTQNCKLVSSEGDTGHYIALSHCWGGRTPAVTTTHNLNDRFNEIAWNALPKTFQDAVHVVRFLGFRYLWIDSLCIIQNDRADWHKQCPEMASIYSKAVMTIAVAGAKDAYEGFLRPRVSRDKTHLIHLRRSGSKETTIGVTPSINCHNGKWLRQYEGSRALASRGWAFQERLLSPRVLHFGTRQAYFECGCAKACESFRDLTEGLQMDPDGESKDPLTGNHATLLQNWYGVVQDYSLCKLKYGNDKLPALAGLASAFEHLLCDDYYAGLWKTDMVRGLSWSRAGSEGRRRELGRFGTADYYEPRSALPADVLPPSWSWASCDYAISNHRGNLGTPEIEILHPSVVSGCGSKLGQTSSESLVVRGKLKDALIRVNKVEDEEEAHLQDAEAQADLCQAQCDDPDMIDQVRMSTGDDTLVRRVKCLLLHSRPEPLQEYFGQCCSLNLSQAVLIITD